MKGALLRVSLPPLVGLQLSFVGLAVLGVVAAQWLFLLHLLRQYGRLLARLEALEGDGPAEGLPVGETAPDFELPSLDGNRVTLESLRAPGKPVVLLFTAPDCSPCVEKFPEIGQWQAEHSGTLTVAVVSEGEHGENATMASERGLTNVLLQEDWEVGGAYGADWTPSAILVRPDGTIGSPMHGGTREVMGFLARTAQEEAIQESISL